MMVKVGKSYGTDALVACTKVLWWWKLCWEEVENVEILNDVANGTSDVLRENECAFFVWM